MMNLDQFAKRMTVIAKGVEANSTKAVGAVVNAIAVPLVQSTPVDTSRARANWQAAVAVPPKGVLFPEPSEPPNAGVGYSLGVSSIKAAAKAYKGHKSGVFIVNNLHYMESLNNGSSTQAPVNFVETSIIRAVRALDSVKLVK